MDSSEVVFDISSATYNEDRTSGNNRCNIHTIYTSLVRHNRLVYMFSYKIVNLRQRKSKVLQFWFSFGSVLVIVTIHVGPLVMSTPGQFWFIAYLECSSLKWYLIYVHTIFKIGVHQYSPQLCENIHWDKDNLHKHFWLVSRNRICRLTRDGWSQLL